jgi:orotate phosphoribosyltransferase
MSDTEILDLLQRTGAMAEGHYVDGEGLHSGRRLRIVKALQFAPFNRKLCYEIVRHYLELDIHVVMALSISSIPMAVEIGRQLEARTIFTTESAGGISLYDGFEMHDGERVVIAQGILRNDSELDGATRLVRRSNARLVGVGSIIDARSVRKKFTVKDVAAIQIPTEAFSPDSCPLCAAGIPLET